MSRSWTQRVNSEDAHPGRMLTHGWMFIYGRMLIHGRMFNYGGCLSREDAQLGKMFIHGGCSLMTVQLGRMLTQEGMLI